MKRKRNIHALVILNALLLGALGFVTFTPTAGAQSRRNGLYTLVGGTANGQVQGVAYIVDEVNQEMVAITWNEGTKTLNGLGYNNLAQDATRLNGGARP